MHVVILCVLRYQLFPKEYGALLRIIPIEKDGRDFARVGLKLNTDFANNSSFGLVAGLRRSWLNNLGAEWQVQGELGETRSLYTELYQPTVLNGEFFIAPWFGIKDEPRDIVVDHETIGTKIESSYRWRCRYWLSIRQVGRSTFFCF
jgi:NTE family protein